MLTLATEANDADRFMPRLAALLRAHGPSAKVRSTGEAEEEQHTLYTP